MADETAPGEEPPAEKPKHDQAFFLALAAKGKDAWNTWRRDPANKDTRVNFAGIDFSEAPRDQINFEGFKFGDDADFSRCKWRGVVVGWKSLWAAIRGFAPAEAHFTGAAFGDSAKFSGAAFGGFANFRGATLVGRPTSLARPSVTKPTSAKPISRAGLYSPGSPTSNGPGTLQACLGRARNRLRR